MVTEAGENVLDVGLSNGNPLAHPSPALINAGRVEYSHVEDTKYGLVTWTSLGRAIGVQTSAMDAVIHLFSTLHQKD